MNNTYLAVIVRVGRLRQQDKGNILCHYLVIHSQLPYIYIRQYTDHFNFIYLFILFDGEHNYFLLTIILASEIFLFEAPTGSWSDKMADTQLLGQDINIYRLLQMCPWTKTDL